MKKKTPTHIHRLTHDVSETHDEGVTRPMPPSGTAGCICHSRSARAVSLPHLSGYCERHRRRGCPSGSGPHHRGDGDGSWSTRGPGGSRCSAKSAPGHLQRQVARWYTSACYRLGRGSGLAYENHNHASFPLLSGDGGDSEHLSPPGSDGRRSG